MMTDKRPDGQYKWMGFLQWYARVIIVLAVTLPYLALLWYLIIQPALAGVLPEPDWYLQFEAALGITW